MSIDMKGPPFLVKILSCQFTAETMDDIDSGLAFFGTFDITKMNNGKAQLPCLFMHMRILEFVWHLNLGCGLQVFSGIKRVSQKPTSVSGASGIRSATCNTRRGFFLFLFLSFL